MSSTWAKFHDLFASTPYNFPETPSHVTARNHPHTSPLGNSKPQPGIHDSSVPDPMFKSRSVPLPVQVTPPDSRSSSRQREGVEGSSQSKGQRLKRSDAIRENSRRQDSQRYEDRNGVSAEQIHHSGTSTPSSAYITPPPRAADRSDVHRFRQNDKVADEHIPRVLTHEMSKEIFNVARSKAHLVDDNTKHHSQHAVVEEISPTLDEQKRETAYTQMNDFIHAGSDNKDTSPPTGLNARPAQPGMCQACAVRPAVPDKSLPEIDLALCERCAGEKRRHRHRHGHHQHRDEESSRRHGEDDSRHHRREGRDDDHRHHDDRSRSHRDKDEHPSHRSGKSSSSTRSDSHRSKGSSRSKARLPVIAEEPKSQSSHQQQSTGSSSRTTTGKDLRCHVCGGPTATSPQRENDKEMNPLCSSCYDRAFYQASLSRTAEAKQPKIRHLTPPVAAPAPAPAPAPTLNSLSHRKNPPPQPPTLNTGHRANGHKEVLRPKEVPQREEMTRKEEIPRRKEVSQRKEEPRREEMPRRKESTRQKEVPQREEMIRREEMPRRKESTRHKEMTRLTKVPEQPVSPVSLHRIQSSRQNNRPRSPVSPLSPPHLQTFADHQKNRQPSPPYPRKPSHYYPDISRKWETASSVYGLRSPTIAPSTPTLPGSGRKYTASTYQGILSQPPTEIDFGNRNANANANGSKLNGGGSVENANSKTPEKNKEEVRDSGFYQFYDAILETPAPSEFSVSQEMNRRKKELGSGKWKGKEKEKNAVQDIDWDWENY